MRKNTSRVALCGVLSALAAAVMMLSYLPSMTYAVPAVAGLVFVVVVMEAGYKWAFGAYAATSFLVLLFAEPEAKVMFIVFFGYYPIIKGLVERLRKPVIELIIKFAVFNAVMIGAYLLIIYVLQLPMDDLGDFGKYTTLILLGLGNVTFVVYDFAISRLITAYLYKLHPKLKKFFR